MGLYIIGNKNKGLCKIGVSKNPEKRLKSIQTGCPYKVDILVYIKELEYDSEKNLHKRYKDYRMHGEWFRIKGELEKLINDQKSKSGLELNKSNIKEIPSISDEEYWELTKKRKGKKNRSKYVKSIFNHK